MNRFLLLLLCLSATRLAAQSCYHFSYCPSLAEQPYEYCNPAPNSTELWNEPYWTDPADGSHDLQEALMDMRLEVNRTCPGIQFAFKYQLFLDLDGDGTQETVVDSEHLPGFNTVNFGNAANPDFLGGTPRAFDERPVPANQKYGFALEVVQTDVEQFTAFLKWNTAAAPGTYELPKLPRGLHRMKWFVKSSTGEEQGCEFVFLVKKDCLPPTIVCQNNIVVNIMPTTVATVWAPNFLLYVHDNVSPDLQVDLGLRRLNAGQGFPEDSLGQPISSITYSCDDLGEQYFELWARDEAGNADFCAGFVVISDANQNCGFVGTQTAQEPLQWTAANPFSDRLHVEWPVQQDAALLFQLTDMTGREVLRHRENGGNRAVDLPAGYLPDGFYVLSVTEEMTGLRRVRTLIKNSF